MASPPRKRIALLTNGLLWSYQLALRDALERSARRRGCDLLAVLGRELEHPDANERAQNTLFDWLSPYSVDGVVALSGVLVNHSGTGALQRILERLVPLPCVSIGVALPGVHSLTVDNRLGMRAVVTHLIERHASARIAYIGGPRDNQEAEARLQGYSDALREHGRALEPELLTHGWFTLGSGQACLREQLGRNVPFDAVVAANDYMALGAIDALTEHGLAIPGQVRVVGFDDSPLARLPSRPLSSVAQPVDAMAERALELLLGPASPAAVETWPLRLMLRNSCGCGPVDRRTPSAPPSTRLFPETFVSDAERSAEGRAALDLFERFIDLRYAGQRLSTSLEHASIAAELANALPRQGATAACVCLVEPLDPERLRPILILDQGRVLLGPHDSYARSDLVPWGLFLGDGSSFAVMPLTFEQEAFGLFAVAGNASPLVCELFRTQISSAVKLGRLHRRVIEETAARERYDQLQLENEIVVARELQAALAPKHHTVPYLSIAASLLPAKGVGGDYYDVLPVIGGVWLGIGDVTGHGLLSGLIMLMIQSMVTALVTSQPSSSPAELVSQLNRALTANLRGRLGAREHASLLLLHLGSDGALALAGAHEEPIVYRAATQSCELLAVDGMWVGILADIRERTRDLSLQLQPGDLLVLYTDGLIEARNAHGVPFGRERVVEVLRSQAVRGPDAVLTALIASVTAWSVVQQDDVTCVVIRYQPALAMRA